MTPATPQAGQRVSHRALDATTQLVFSCRTHPDNLTHD